MYNVTENIVTFLPPESIEPEAKQQPINISEMPFVFHHVAVMRDCHLGIGANWYCDNWFQEGRHHRVAGTIRLAQAQG
jgi:hypothetical protein